MKSNLDKRNFFPQVLQVVPSDDYKVYAYCNDGAVHCFDVKPFIKPDTVFAPLADIKVFKDKITVINGTVAWDMGGNRDEYGCIDVDPFQIFECPVVPDPLCCQGDENGLNEVRPCDLQQTKQHTSFYCHS